MAIYIHEILCTLIFKYLEFYDKHTFKRIKKNTDRIYITDLFNIHRKYLIRLDDDILKNYKCVVKLSLGPCSKVTQIQHIKKLRELNASGCHCKIDDECIRNINLEKLIAYDNPKITNVNHMTNLKELNAGGNCGINNEGISCVNLEVFDASFNRKITNVNHMSNLKVLDASYNCGIDDQGIINVNLEVLDAESNSKISKVNHMSNLKVLNANSSCGIDDKGISDLSLEKLCADFNSKITSKIRNKLLKNRKKHIN